MPTTLQYPVERNRDVQRKWRHLLQRTAASKSHASVVKYSPSRAAVSTGVMAKQTVSAGMPPHSLGLLR